MRLTYFAEAAYFQGVVRQNSALARAWLDEARAVKGAVAQKEWDAMALAAIAYAEGNEKEFVAQRIGAMQYLDRLPGPSGSVASSRARAWRDLLFLNRPHPRIRQGTDDPQLFH